MNNTKRKAFFVICITLILSFPLTSIAHSGRTDSSGGHHDYKNKSGLGSYHYHHGYPAHLHTNGCPYASSVQTKPQPQYDYITMDEYTAELFVGESSNISFTMYSFYNDFSYTIVSSDPNILKINDDDTMTAVSAGTVNVIIKTNHAEKTLTITVNEILAEEIELHVYSNKLQIGNTMQITSVLYPSNTTNQEIIYSSSDNSIATVSPDGIIEGISTGAVTIMATASNGISGLINIDIYEVFPERILCDNSINMIVGDSIELPFKISPSNANNKQYFLSCENDEIIKYSDSELNAIAEGETTLHIETWNGIKKDITVKVDIIPVEDIKIADLQDYRFSNVIDKNDKISLRYSIFPLDATYQYAEWESSDENIVKIDKNNFVITGTGKVTISCSSHNNITDSIDMYIIDLNLWCKSVNGSVRLYGQ